MRRCHLIIHLIKFRRGKGSTPLPCIPFAFWPPPHCPPVQIVKYIQYWLALEPQAVDPVNLNISSRSHHAQDFWHLLMPKLVYGQVQSVALRDTLARAEERAPLAGYDQFRDDRLHLSVTGNLRSGSAFERLSFDLATT